MTKIDTILIKIQESYKEEISEEELYHATSVSWKLSEIGLKSGEYKYYCAVYRDKIKEVYSFIGYEKDLHPEQVGRFILKGKLAEYSIRSKLIGLNTREIHKGRGNPIKYASIKDLLDLATQKSNQENVEDNELVDKETLVSNATIIQLFKRLAIHSKEIITLGSQSLNRITKVDDEGLYVETVLSREKYSKGEKNHPYDLVSYNFLINAWNEFLSNRTAASAKDFIKTKGRSSFIMAFFNELPFVEEVSNIGAITIKLKEFTTDQLPRTTLDNVLNILDSLIYEQSDTMTNLLDYKNPEEIKQYARKGLNLLGFLRYDGSVKEDMLVSYKDAVNKQEVLRDRIKQHEYFSVILNLLPLIDDLKKNEKLNFLTKVSMLLVRNSKGTNLMTASVSEYRTRNTLNWFKGTGLVDEEWKLMKDEEFESSIYSLKPNANTVIEDSLTMLPIKDIITHIDKYIASKGFYYEIQEIKNLYLCLRTKPFVILSGISGTGKTMIIKWFAESVGATEENGQFSLIPVRPDWNDGSDLLGYVDIAGKFKEGPLTTTIKKALNRPDRPYFVLLDEMNLARVEYYFSDVLSVMESREFKNGRIVTSPLLKEGTVANGNPIYFPENVYIIGTVNMDETTHPFSKKVLDRANTIEFNEVKLDYLEFLGNIPLVEPIKLHNNSFLSSYIHLKDVNLLYSDLVKETTEHLVNLNNILKTIGAHIGYRGRDEICFYLAFNKQGDVMTFEQALDRCILQKILPRISGSDTRVDRTLRGLFKYFTGSEIVQDLEVYEEDIQLAKYPKCATKTFEMLRRLRDDGFTSFWIS
jgi:hypothetical protein